MKIPRELIPTSIKIRRKQAFACFLGLSALFFLSGKIHPISHVPKILTPNFHHDIIILLKSSRKLSITKTPLAATKGVFLYLLKALRLDYLSPKSRRDVAHLKPLGLLGLGHFFSQFGTRHLKGGVVVAPPDFRFFLRKNHPIFSTQEIKKAPKRSNLFKKHQGSLQPIAEGSPTPDTLLCPLSYPFPVARR